MGIQRLVFLIQFWSTLITLICASSGCNWKKNYLLWLEHALKKCSIFWPRSRFRTFGFPFFRTSETCFSTQTSIVSKKNFCEFFGYSSKNYLLWRENVFKKKSIFLPKSRFQKLVFTFFVTQRHVFQRMRMFFLYPEKNNLLRIEHVHKKNHFLTHVEKSNVCF